MKITGWSGEGILKDLNISTQNQGALHCKSYGKLMELSPLGYNKPLDPVADNLQFQVTDA